MPDCVLHGNLLPINDLNKWRQLKQRCGYGKIPQVAVVFR